MSVSRQALGALEAAVMEIVWSRGSVTAREVCSNLTGRRRRAYTTIMTTMDRLHRKGVLRRTKDGIAWRYEPRVDKVAFERAVADRLAARILSGHGETGLAAFVDAAARIDEKLLDHLRALIERRRSKSTK